MPQSLNYFAIDYEENLNKKRLEEDLNEQRDFRADKREDISDNTRKDSNHGSTNLDQRGHLDNEDESPVIQPEEEV